MVLPTLEDLAPPEDTMAIDNFPAPPPPDAGSPPTLARAGGLSGIVRRSRSQRLGGHRQNVPGLVGTSPQSPLPEEPALPPMVRRSSLDMLSLATVLGHSAHDGASDRYDEHDEHDEHSETDHLL